MEKNTQSKKGFAKLDLVIVLIVIAVLAAVMIPLLAKAIKATEENATLQDQTSQQLTDLANKVANTQTGITAAELEAKLADALSKIEHPAGITAQDVSDAIKAAINSYKTRDLSATTVQTMINNAIAKIEFPAGLDAAAVEKIVNDAIAAIELPDGTPAAGLTEAQVKAIVDNAVAALKAELGTTVTKAQMEQAIADALKNVTPGTGLTAAEVQAIVNNAIAGIDTGLNATEVQALIDAAIAALKNEQPQQPEQPPVQDEPTVVSTSAELQAAVTAGEDAILAADVDLRYVIVPANTNMTLDLNGKTLSVYEIEVQGNGKLQLKDGSLAVDGYVYVGDELGVLVIDNVDVEHKYDDGNCIRNYGTAFISDCTFTATSTVDGETLLINWGTMIVEDTDIVSVAKPAKPEDFAVYNSGTMTLTRVNVTANGYCVMNVDLKEDDGFTAITNINGGTYTSNDAVVADTFDSIYVVSSSANGKIVMSNNAKLIAPAQNAGIRNFGEVVGVNGVDYSIVIPE